MALRPIRYRDLPPEKQADYDYINACFQVEHDTLSNAFYQKKHSIGVTAEEEVIFKAAHDALQPKYDEERMKAGLLEEYDELMEIGAVLQELLESVNAARQERGLQPLKLTEVTT